jgi:hypothetical protein
MTSLAEINRTLPNGFHDSEVRSCKLDFVARTAAFEIDVWVGDLDTPTRDGRELYRAGLLVVSGLAFCQVDAPDPTYPYQDAAPIRIDLSEPDRAIPAIRALPPAIFVGRFYVSNWNAFIHLAGCDAKLSWSDERMV